MSQINKNKEAENSSEVGPNEARVEIQDIYFASDFNMMELECCDNENLLVSFCNSSLFLLS